MSQMDHEETVSDAPNDMAEPKIDLKRWSTSENPTSGIEALENHGLMTMDSMQVNGSDAGDANRQAGGLAGQLGDDGQKLPTENFTEGSDANHVRNQMDEDQNLGGFLDIDLLDEDHKGSDVSSAEKYACRNSEPGIGAEYGVPMLPTAAESVSLGTATQTHEVRMPMVLATFKPATGCTNASDFIVRCFVARLRAGITVVKHGRSRWCKSRLRVLHVHADGRSLSWKPASGEPSSGKRPPKLDLSTCKEVRHAWSPDPDNPMFTGTTILRQKCEAANAHKSFALIFPKRTVDITAVTADQCKVLMEGFSALCFRLQVANMANRGGATAAAATGKKDGEDDEDRTTASVTLTNTSITQQSPGGTSGKKRTFR